MCLTAFFSSLRILCYDYINKFARQEKEQKKSEIVEGFHYNLGRFVYMDTYIAGLLRWCIGKKICLPMQETQEMWVLSLGWEDPLEKEMETHSSILAWEIPWTEEPDRIQSMESQESNTI